MAPWPPSLPHIPTHGVCSTSGRGACVAAAKAPRSSSSGGGQQRRLKGFGRQKEAGVGGGPSTGGGGSGSSSSRRQQQEAELEQELQEAEGDVPSGPGQDAIRMRAEYQVTVSWGAWVGWGQPNPHRRTPCYRAWGGERPTHWTLPPSATTQVYRDAEYKPQRWIGPVDVRDIAGSSPEGVEVPAGAAAS